MAFARIVLFALTLLCMAACAAYHPMPLRREESRQILESRRLSDPDLVSQLAHLLPSDDPAASITWGPAQLLVAAAHFNPSLAESRSKLIEATAATQTAKAIPNPTVSLSTDYITTAGSGMPLWLYGASTSFLLEPALIRRLRLHIAESSVRAARLDYADAIWTTRRDVHASLLAAIISSKRIELLTAAEHDRDRLVQMMNERVTTGEAAPSERLQLALELTRARTALADAERQRADALARLAAAVGVPISALGDVPLGMDNLDRPESVDLADFDRLRAQALLSRTDLERAAVDYDSRELELHQQVRLQYPQLSLGPGYTYDHGTPKATFGVSFNLPLFNHNQGPIAEAEARRATAAQHVLAVQAQVLNEVDGTLIAYRQSLESLSIAEHQAASAHEIADHTQKGFAVGAEDRPTLLTARLTANTEDLAALDALNRAQQALAQLEDALRTPLHGREKELNSSSDWREP